MSKGSKKVLLIFLIIIGIIFFPQYLIVGIILYCIFKAKKPSLNTNYSWIDELKEEVKMSDKIIGNSKVHLTGHTKSETPFDHRKLRGTKTTVALQASYPSTYLYINSQSLVVNEPIEGVKIDPKYLNNINKILEDTIKEELAKNNVDEKIITPSIRIRKYAICILFAIFNFVCLSFIFFHLPIWTLLLEVINIVIFIAFGKKYTIISYLKKQIKARPDDKISDIVSSMIAEQVPNKNLIIVKTFIILASFILPLFIYFNPHIFYEKYEDGYGVRFYTIGLTNFTKAVIPETHKGHKVLSIRGNVFANILTLKEVILPDSIVEIRGKAFLNDRALESIKLPSSLEYLGGGAFKNCISLKEISIPLGVTEINGETFNNCLSLERVNLHNNITSIHGESFVNCQKLDNIILPTNITEISGNTFENCSSLHEIIIPEGVTRIGGHAFYGCSSLRNVYIPDSVKEIGSSAFRQCSSLRSVEIPEDAVVNSRAFKESPTIVTRRNAYYTESLYD